MIRVLSEYRPAHNSIQQVVFAVLFESALNEQSEIIKNQDFQTTNNLLRNYLTTNNLFLADIFLRTFVDKGAMLHLTTTSQNKAPLLQLATEHENPEFIKLILERAQTPSDKMKILLTQDREGYSALHLAALKGNQEMKRVGKISF